MDAKECLYNYPFWVKLIEMKEDDIINSSSSSDDGMPRGTDKSDLTQSKAFKLIGNEELQEIKRKVKCVEACLGYLENQNTIYKDIIELKYFQRNKLDKEIYDDLMISERTFYRYNNSILRVVNLFI